MSTQKPNTNVNAFLEDLGGGKYHRQIGQILSEVAKAVVDSDDQKKAKGKVILTLDISRVGNTAQVLISHDIKYDRPTISGRRSENSGDMTYMYANINGDMTLTQPDNYLLIGDQNEDIAPLELTPELLYTAAVEDVKKNQRVSISYIQRKFSIGYNRSAEIVARMEKENIISEPKTNGTREVYS